MTSSIFDWLTENAAYTLPMKLRKLRPCFFNPTRGCSLDLLHDASYCGGSRKSKQRMGVIFDATDNQSFAVVFAKHLREICVHLATQNFVSQKRKTIFG